MSPSNENSGATAWSTERSSPAGTAPEQSRDQAAVTGPAPSYSTHVHLNYVATLHETGNRGEDRKVHQIRYSYGSEMRTSSSDPQSHMLITCKIDVKGDADEVRVDIDASASEAEPVASPDTPHRPGDTESAEDALKTVREQRSAALKEMFGAWKDRDDTPKDGLQYQIESRAEWP
ncbi:hypothetical protein F2P45_07930 [Massilia sp. CCM 8733]|uniref:Uncharacterized protein n=1 Tax=Massilia mucilaginosa TaxID=2609282 RepID=A0ABX0NQD8_9BURK|nr:hypothetical protein [Massilia mucilaginosa]NHZ88948.1 hypothetical protein [Massilia mucilaginosa]